MKVFFALALTIHYSNAFANTSPTLTMSYSPDKLFYGQSHTLTWSTSGAVECHNNSGTNVGTSGTWTTTRNFIGNGASKLICTNSEGSVTKVATYEVLDANTPLTLTMSYSPDKLYYGQSHTLTWSTSGAFECHNSSGTSVGTSGTWTTTRNFFGNGASKFICTNSKGSITKVATYEVLDVTPASEAVSSLTALFDANYNSTWVSGITSSVVQMYIRWPAMDGLVDMYKTTGRSDYIQKALAMGYAYKDKGQDLDNDGYLDWTSPYIPLGHSHNHYEWRAGAGIARVLGEVFSNPNLVMLRPESQGLLEFAEEHIWNKWETELNQTTVTHFIGRAGNIAIGLYKATDKIKYRQYINDKGWQLKNSLQYVSSKNAYNITCYISGAACNSGVGTIDTSHAGDSINFMFEAYREGCVNGITPCVFDAIDITRLQNTITKVLWNQDVEFPKFNDWVNGASIFGSEWYGQNQGGWIKLARYDDHLKETYFRWLNTKGINSGQYVKSHYIGNLAASYGEVFH